MSSIEEIMQVKSPYKSSPIKDVGSPSSTAYNHLSNFLSQVEEWKKLKSKGLKIAQSIQSLELHEISAIDFPKRLFILSESLEEAGKGMKLIVEDLISISKKMNALNKFHSSHEPLVNTWTVDKLAKHVEKLSEMFEKEMNLKNAVIENICHSKEESLTEVYVSSWEYDVYIDHTAVSLLRVELNIEQEQTNITKEVKSQ